MVGNNHGKLAGNLGKEYISFCSGMVLGSRRLAFRLLCDFRAEVLVAVRTSLFMAEPSIFHDKTAISGIGRIDINIITSFFKRTFICRVVGNQGF